MPPSSANGEASGRGALTHRSRPRWSAWLACLAVVTGLFLAAVVMAPHAPVDPRVAFVSAFACVVSATVFASWYAPAADRSQLWILALPLLALAWAASHPDSRNAQALLVLLGLLAAGTVAGSVVGSRVQAAGHLVFVALISSAADIFSVYAPLGPSGAIVESPTTLNLLALPWPLLGTDAVPPILGVGDVVFAALYRSAARAHQLSPGRTLAALLVAFGLTLATLLWTEAAIPALPFLGLTMVIAHPEARRVPEADRKRGWTAALALLVVLGLLASYRR